jgi:hypothetical protein
MLAGAFLRGSVDSTISIAGSLRDASAVVSLFR